MQGGQTLLFPRGLQRNDPVVYVGMGVESKTRGHEIRAHPTGLLDYPLRTGEPTAVYAGEDDIGLTITCAAKCF